MKHAVLPAHAAAATPTAGPATASAPLSISQLLRSNDADRVACDRMVAFGTGGTRTAGDFIGQTAALRERLADGGGARYLIHCDDAYAFAVTLAALSVSGNVGVLAPNAQAGTLNELSAGTAGAIATIETTLRNCINPLDLDPKTTARAQDLTVADPERPLFEMFTSGSTGAPDKIVKALGHLESEVRALERSFHAVAESAHVFATVSPQHLYGLLFRVLWPLATGRPFQRETLLRPEELAARIAATDCAMLIGTPTHLRILAASPALSSAAAKLKSVFSSGGPLAYETAAAVERATGIAPIEIFGSTETGGIAHRTRHRPDTPWVLLDGVGVEIEPDDRDGPDSDGADKDTGRLVVSSPFVSAGQRIDESPELRFVTGDRIVRIADEPVLTFRLAGRADRVVQIAEKRIDLSELELKLLEHALVDEVAATAIELQGTTRVGVLVVLSHDGRLALAQRGRAQLRAELSDTLAPFYDRVALPRRWRFVPTLPRDAQGKLAAAEVTTALADRLTETNIEPILLGDSSTADLIERRYVVPNDLAYLEGHFDRFPLVAGVVQVKWAIEAAAELLPEGSPMPDPRSLKFKQALRPLQEFTLRVRFDRTNGRAEFSIANEYQLFSSGLFVMERP